MPAFQTEVIIASPVERVFAYLTRAENIPQWANHIKQVTQVPEGSPDVGTQIFEQVNLAGRRFEVCWQITEFEPNIRCTFQSKTFLGHSTVTYLFQENDRGTRLVVRFTTEPAGWLRWAAPLLRRAGLRERKRLLNNIRSIIEQEV